MSIRIMSYNVCHYNFDQGATGFPAAIINEKVMNLKEMLMETAPDLIGLQEDVQYCDTAQTKTSVDYLFNPVWTGTGTGQSTIRYKPEYVRKTQKLVQFSTGRVYRRAIFLVDGKRLLFISAHPTPFSGAENQAKRKAEYTQLFTDIKALRWDWCVVVGDMNTFDTADKENLKAICSENGFDMAIGTYLPWIPTCLGHDGKGTMSFDNILVSGNITIQTTKALREWYGRLYSDHVPLIADLQLR